MSYLDIELEDDIRLIKEALQIKDPKIISYDSFGKKTKGIHDLMGENLDKHAQDLKTHLGNEISNTSKLIQDLNTPLTKFEGILLGLFGVGGGLLVSTVDKEKIVYIGLPLAVIPLGIWVGLFLVGLYYKKH